MMKRVFILFISGILFCAVVHAQVKVREFSKKELKEWFDKKEWLGGLSITPNKSINAKELAKQYQLNKVYWDKAFAFLKEHDHDSLVVGKYVIDEGNVIASVTEERSKDFSQTHWESNRKFINIEYIVSGEESVGVAPVSESTVTKVYEEKKDAAYYDATGKFYVGHPGEFFIFFPSDVHRTNIATGGNKLVRRIIIKVVNGE